MGAHRLVGRWRFSRTGTTLIVKHVFEKKPSRPAVARVSLGGMRQIAMTVSDIDALRKAGAITYVGR